MKRSWIVRRVLGFIVIAIAGAFIIGSIVMLLWNALMPVLFHLPAVTFWQALGLLILTKILFSGFRGGPRPPWKNRMKQKWMNMTPEERERFRQNWNNRCGGRPFPGDRPFPTDRPFSSEGPAAPGSAPTGDA